MEPYHHQGCFWLSCVRDGNSIEFCKRLELNSAGGGNMPDSPSSLFLIPLVQPLTMNQMRQASVCILHFAFFQSKHCFVTIKELNGYSHSQEKLPTMGICLQGATQYLWWNISETKYFWYKIFVSGQNWVFSKVSTSPPTQPAGWPKTICGGILIALVPVPPCRHITAFFKE